MRDIRSEVRSALKSEPRIGTFELSDVAFAADGALIIAGEVGSVMAKKLALERVGALPDVDLIIDRLHVRPAEPMGDAEIRAHLRNAFLQEPSFAGLSIAQADKTARQPIVSPTPAIGDLDFEVEDGIVILNGNAPGLATKRLAGLLAWWVPGSRDVINGIALAEDEDDSPQAVEEAVRIALEKDPFVNASQIRVGARHHVVRLTGLVSSQAERDMAEADAWYVFGVDDVINEIEVGG
jgi:osmotically-inducible protein OsmY